MLKKIVVLFQLQTSESFTVYVINVNVPRVRANADKCLQHQQGCPETPKSADLICERPLISVFLLLTIEAKSKQYEGSGSNVDVVGWPHGRLPLLDTDTATLPPP